MPEDASKHRSDEPRLVTLPATLGSFGAVIHFLAADETFARQPLGRIVMEVSVQLHNKWNVCAVRDNKLVGYCGLIFTTRERAEKYVRGEALADVDIPPEEADTPALTLVRVVEPQMVLPLMRFMRNLYPGKRVVFRREYLDPKKPKRASSVVNMTASGNLDKVEPETPVTITISPE